MIAGLLSPGEEKLRIKEVAYEGLRNFNICSIVVPMDLVLPINFLTMIFVVDLEELLLLCFISGVSLLLECILLFSNLKSQDP